MTIHTIASKFRRAFRFVPGHYWFHCRSGISLRSYAARKVLADYNLEMLR